MYCDETGGDYFDYLFPMQLGEGRYGVALGDVTGHGIPAALVMTSGNASDEPICRGNREALDRLGEIADVFLLHDRDVVRRVDDSVVRAEPGGVFAVWGENYDTGFIKRLTEAGFVSTRHRSGRAGSGHVVYLGRKETGRK